MLESTHNFPSRQDADYDNLFNSIRKALQRYSDKSVDFYKTETPDFNLFTVISPLEIQISRLIGELLNPEGKHGHGTVFLDLFIQTLGTIYGNLESRGFPKDYKKATVELEHQIDSIDGAKGRIDILIDFDGIFGMAMENKPYALDQEAQCHRYNDYLIRKYPGDKYLLFYLNPYGSNPSDASITSEMLCQLKKAGTFNIIKYRDIIDWCNKCCDWTKKEGARRLSILIDEFSEFLRRQFYGENTMKNKLLEKEIEENILEAFEIYSIWSNNKELKNVLIERINNLFNKILPELVFEELKNSGVIDDNWEIITGDFDIRKKHLKGFILKKKNWKHFEIGILSDRVKYDNNTFLSNRGMFPAIISKKDIQKENYIAFYNEMTGCKAEKSQIFLEPRIVWWANFPNKDYYVWRYEHWAGIKEGGDTVKYVADFLSKLIKACEADIDEEEKRLQDMK